MDGSSVEDHEQHSFWKPSSRTFQIDSICNRATSQLPSTHKSISFLAHSNHANSKHACIDSSSSDVFDFGRKGGVGEDRPIEQRLGRMRLPSARR
mmetsp:Transcript_4815/g.13883  ORF Transcript_4815/g.13883 Transcript_4815/m.13883 type:complete len:95 (+) Transcript_4815:280-564(+)